MKFYALLCVSAAVFMILTPAVVLLHPSETTYLEQTTNEEAVTMLPSENKSTVTAAEESED